MAYNRRILFSKGFPAWDTPEGTLGSFDQESPITPIQLVASELKEPGSTITYAVTTGSLPTGLTMTSAGLISGTMTGYEVVTQIYFSVTATDDEGETASRDFSITAVPIYQITYLSVAGGGAGAGTGLNGGAGGAGGYLTGLINPNVGTVYSISIGTGGTNSAGPNNGSPGGNTTITASGMSDIISIGGGGGAQDSSASIDGGSGGGGGVTVGGTGSQGFDGGSGIGSSHGGGGGGAGESGADATSSNGGKGGDGLESSITGTPTYLAGGGGGGAAGTGGGSGGLGGGGSRTNPYTGAADNGDPNTGGGGGGGFYNGTHWRGGNGGSGVVIFRIKTDFYSGTTTGSPTVATDGIDTILTYTGSGTYTA